MQLTRKQLAALLDEASTIREEYAGLRASGELTKELEAHYKSKYREIDKRLANYEVVDEPDSNDNAWGRLRALDIFKKGVGAAREFVAESNAKRERNRKLKAEAEEAAKQLAFQMHMETIERKRLSDAKIVCPQCHERGYVITVAMEEILTQTAITGIFQEKEEVGRNPFTEAYCSNCDSRWRF